MLKQFWEVKHLWGMPPKNSGGSTKFPGGHKVIHRTAQTAFVRVVTPRSIRMNRHVIENGDIIHFVIIIVTIIIIIIIIIIVINGVSL